MTVAGTAPPVAHPVLRVRDDSGPSTGSGWATPDHHADRLRSAVGGEILRGTGFGGPWPVVAIRSGALAGPGLPVVVGPRAVEGPDATYDRDDHAVWRETAAGRRPLISMEATTAGREERTELLWFDDTSRWRVCGGLLEIEDGFSRVTVAATSARLEQLLIRRRRIAEEVLDGVAVTAGGSRTTRVEVWRDRQLVPDAITRTAVPLLAGRPEIARLESRGERLEGEGVDGSSLQLSVTRRADGWTVERHRGTLPFSSLELESGSDRVRLAAEVDPAVDCLAPGMRQRLVFDLYSDLVTAGRDSDQKL